VPITSESFFVGVVIVLAIWQISLFHYTLKWDAIDITFAWRYFVSDAWLNGTIPWWNPFQFQGFAQGLSLESWYPLGLLLGLTQGYGLYSLNLEYLLHLFIASYGFYRLARVLEISHRGAIFGALVFPLCGFFVANAQHTGWIASGAWLPHVFASYLSWKHSPNLKQTLLLALLVFMLVSGGYIAFSIIAAYILSVTSIVAIISRLKKTGSTDVLWLTGRLLFCIVAMCSLLIVCLWQLKEQIDRGHGLSGEAIFKGSLHAKHLISLLFPYATVKGNFETWSGDQSMINVYLGLPCLLLLILSLHHLKTKFFRSCWIVAITGLALALAVELPFRSWLNALPLFDLFRFPSLFRYFFILPSLLIGAKMVSDYEQGLAGRAYLDRSFNRAIRYLLLTCLTVLILCWSQLPSLSKVFSFSIDTIIEAVTLQCLTQIVILSSFLLASRYAKSRFTFFQLLMLLAACDMFIFCQLNGRVSIFSEDSFSSIQACVKELPKGYPLPELDDRIGGNDDRNLHFGPIYRNNNQLYKRIGWNGYTPYQYQRFIEFEKTPYYQKSLNLPALFVSEPISEKIYRDGYYESDAILNLSDSSLSVSSFGPNHIEAISDLTFFSTLVYNQNYRDNWEVTVDGEAKELLLIDHSLMGARVSPGKHIIKFKYVPGRLKNALIISLVSLFLGFGFYVWENRDSSVQKLFLALGLVLILIRVAYPYSAEGSRTGQQVRSPTIIAKHQPNQRSRSFLDAGDLERFQEVVLNQQDSFDYIVTNTCLASKDRFYSFLKHNAFIIDSSFHNGFDIYHCADISSTVVIFTSYNSFETYQPFWKDQGVALKCEKNNQYQSLLGRKYSTSFDLNLNKYQNATLIDILVDHRNQGPSEALIVCTILSGEGEEVFWKSLRLPAFESNDGTWRHQNWKVKLPAPLTNAETLRIYVWNNGKTQVEIDKFKISLLSP
jgi:hypothetical protein